MTRACNKLISRKAREWREWAEKFVSNTKKCVARLVKIFCRDLLDEIFESQVTIAMLRPLRFIEFTVRDLRNLVEGVGGPITALVSSTE